MSKLRRSARGKPCTLNIPGVCSYSPEQTVLAHIRGMGAGEGMGRKPESDLAGVYACAYCHDCLDGRQKGPDDFRTNRWMYIARALYRTHRIMWDEILEKAA